MSARPVISVPERRSASRERTRPPAVAGWATDAATGPGLHRCVGRSQITRGAFWPCCAPLPWPVAEDFRASPFWGQALFGEAWAAVTRVTWWCQPGQDRPSKWSRLVAMSEREPCKTDLPDEYRALGEPVRGVVTPGRSGLVRGGAG